jgi:dihydrofolate reductase
MPRLSLIAAHARNGVIGRNNGLPWRLSSDLKRFRELTMGHHIVMGRKTYESIGRPLPGRKMVVVTSRKNFSAPECEIATSLEQAIDLAQGDSEVFFIGGAEIYRQVLDRVDRLYLTSIDAVVEGDAFLPPLDLSGWRLVSEEEHGADEKNAYPYRFTTYDRVQ